MSATAALAQQQKTFTKWVNAKLRTLGSSSPPPIANLSRDLRDGLALLALVRTLAPPATPADAAALSPERHTVLRIHQILNVGKALNYVARVSGAPLPSIGAEDIVDGNAKLTLGLVWVLILRFQLASIAVAVDETIPDAAKSPVAHPLALSPEPADAPATAPAAEGDDGSSEDRASTPVNMTNDPPPTASESSPKPKAGGDVSLNEAQQSLLRWVASQLAAPCYAAVTAAHPPTNFNAAWRSGALFLALVHSSNPALFDAAELAAGEGADAHATLARAFALAEDELGIPALLDPEDLDVPDDKSVMTYVSSFYVALHSPRASPTPPADSATTPPADSATTPAAAASLRSRGSIASLASTTGTAPSTPLLGTVNPADMSPAHRDLRHVAGELAALRRAAKRVAIDYPDLDAREAALANAGTRLAGLKEELKETADRYADEVAAGGGDVPAQAALAKATGYVDDVTLIVKRQTHGLALERLIRDFYEDCDSCHKWIADSSLSLLLQTQKTEALRIPADTSPPSPKTLADFAAQIREVRHWCDVMDAHLGEFSATLDALRATAKNIVAHVGDSAKFADVAATVHTRESDVMAAWNTFNDGYTKLRAAIEPRNAQAELVAAVLAAGVEVDAVASDLNLVLESAPAPAEPAEPEAGRPVSLISDSGKPGGGDAALSTIVQAVDRLQPKLDAVQRQVAAWRDRYAALLGQGTNDARLLAAAVAHVESAAEAATERLLTAYRAARAASLARDWATAAHYVRQVRDSLPQLAWASPADTDAEAVAALVSAAAAVASTGSTLASYEARVLRKLEEKTDKHAAELDDAQAAAAKKAAADVLGVWAEAMAQYNAIKAEHADQAWVVDAARALGRVEFRLVQITDAIPAHAGKRRSMLSLLGATEAADGETPAATPTTDLVAARTALDDLRVDIDTLPTEFPRLEELEILGVQLARLAEKRDKAARIVDTLEQRRAASAKSDECNRTLAAVVDDMQHTMARVAMARAELAAVPDPRTATVDTSEAAAAVRETLAAARAELRAAQDRLAAVHAAVDADDLVRVDSTAAEARVDAVADELAACTAQLDAVAGAQDAVKAASDQLDDVERALRAVDIAADAVEDGADAADRNAARLAKARALLDPHSEASVPPALHARLRGLAHVHRLLSTYLGVAADLVDLARVPQLVSLDEGGNTRVPTADDHAAFLGEADAAAARFAKVSESVAAWVAEINAFTATDADEARIFAPVLMNAKARAMRAAMDVSDALDARAAAIGLVLRVAETHEAGRGVLAGVKAAFANVEDDENEEDEEDAVAASATAWTEQAADLVPLFVPLQSLALDLDAAVTSMRGRAAAARDRKAAAARVTEITTGVLPALRAALAQAAAATPRDMFAVEPATVALLDKVARDVAEQIEPVQVELVDARFHAVRAAAAAARAEVEAVAQELESLLGVAARAQTFLAAAADVHALKTRVQAAADAVSPAPECSVGQRDLDAIDRDVAAFAAAHAAHTDESAKLAAALDAVRSALAHARDLLRVAEHTREVKALQAAFEARAAEIVNDMDGMQAALTALLDARQSGASASGATAAELAVLEELGEQLARAKADADALPELGSAHPVLAASHVAGDVREREKSVQLSLAALADLHATATSAKQQERRVEAWHVKCSALTATLSSLLDKFKRQDVHLDAVDEADGQVAALQDQLDAALAEFAVLKKEGLGDVATLSTLALLLNRKAAQVHQALAECKRIRELAVRAGELTEQIEGCAADVPKLDDLAGMETALGEVADFEESLKTLIEAEAMHVIASDANQDLVSSLFNELQRSLNALHLAIDTRRKTLEQRVAMQELRTAVDAFLDQIRDAVTLDAAEPMTPDTHAAAVEQFAARVKAATAAFDGLRDRYDAITAQANAALDKIQNVAPLHVLLTEVSTEWTRARDSLKQHTEALGAQTSLSELFTRLARVAGSIAQIRTVLDEVQSTTSEAGMATVQQAARDFAPLRDDLAVTNSVFAKLRESNPRAVAPHAAGFEAAHARVAGDVEVTHTDLTATQTALFKASQLLATCAELMQQCEAILETAEERQATLANDLFFSMELVDAELFVKAALTVHQNAHGDAVRLRGARDRLPLDEVRALTHVAAAFKDRIEKAVADLDSALDRLKASADKELAQIDVLKRVYSHMRATTQILVWLTAAKGAMATLSNLTQVAAIDEIRGKMANFSATIDMYATMSRDLVAAVGGHAVIQERTDRVLGEWAELNSRVEHLAHQAVQESLVMEFHALCDEMEDVMHMYRREVQNVSRDAEQVENEDDHDDMTRQLRKYATAVAEALDPQVARLEEILGSDQVTPDMVEQEALQSRHDFITAQVASLQELIVQRLDLIQVTQQTRAAFEIFAEINKLMASTQSLLDEIRVDQVALLDIDRSVAALQQRQSHYANNIERLFDLVAKMNLRDQVAARRDLLAQQWNYVSQDVAQTVRDLELRKKLLLARMEREREDMQSRASNMGGGGSSGSMLPQPGNGSKSPHLAVRSFLPRPNSPGQPLRNANAVASGLPTPGGSSRLPTPGPPNGGMASGLRPKTPPASRIQRSALRTPPPPMPAMPSRLPAGGSSGSSGLPRPGAMALRSTTPTPSAGYLVSSRRPTAAPRSIAYRADPSDAIDVRLADLVNDLGVFVKIKRLGPGKYAFGDIEGKVINCKLVNHNLLVRVGGGWKDFREYVLELDMAGLIVKSETVMASRINYAAE
ncbi:hypothetical protein H9P43_009474 [Blastocladiella emersonii ATCC 22665]|nr:hypothetical protein H9P43_009474 [Blastocladiella emersonii ATCC 22665]